MIVLGCFFFFISACASDGYGSVPPTSSAPQSSSGPSEQHALELQIIKALEDDYLKAVAIDYGSNTVTITVYTNGAEISETVISGYRQRAATIAPEYEIIVKLESGGPPSPE